jgi:hypothetical protein
VEETMKIKLEKMLLVGMLQLMADCQQDSLEADIEEIGEGVCVLRYGMQDGKLVRASEVRTPPVETVDEAPEPPEPPAPARDLTDAQGLLALKLNELQEIAASLGLPTDGKKPELVNSIVEKASADSQ